MSFYTSLMLYRPTRPPRITGGNLARFVVAFDALRVAEPPEGFQSLRVQVKFGAAIDRDDKPTSWQEPVARGMTIYRHREIDWDVDQRCRSLAEVAATLATEDRPIYRAFVTVGTAADEVCAAVRRDESPTNDEPLGLDSWSITLGPILCHKLGGDVEVHVGYLSVNLHGHGYLHPWSFADLVARAEAAPPICRVAHLCRTTWPVPPGQPPGRVVKARQQIGELWPYPTTKLPWDWYWGLHESG